MAGAGIPLVGGVGGSNQFGNDYMYDSRPNELCPLSSANWDLSSNAGVFALNCYHARGDSLVTSGFRSALYL
jgi:hypothetical protein